MSRTDSSGHDGLWERLERYEDEWLWHEQTDDQLAGHGHHMGQMLYRLPCDGQTTDMQKSIESMLADLRILAEHPATPTEEAAEVADEAGAAERHGRPDGCRPGDGRPCYPEEVEAVAVEVRDYLVTRGGAVDESDPDAQRDFARWLMKRVAALTANAKAEVDALAELRTRAALANPDAAGEGK